MSSPTVRSLKLLRSEGYIAEVVERRRGPVAKDLFGFIDIMAIHPDKGILAVQTTTASNLSVREKKCKAQPAYTDWLNWGYGLELHGWSKRGPRGKRKLWGCTRRPLP